jgi:cell division protein FtsN
MVRKKAKKTSKGKRNSKKAPESLEMFESIFDDNLEMEERQGRRDKAFGTKEDLSESNEMFDTVFRDELKAEQAKEKKGSPAKNKRRKSKSSELPPWKRRAEEEEKTAKMGKKSRPKKRSTGRGRVALLLLFMVLLAGAGLHYYGLADFGPYAAHLKDLKTEALWLYETYAGKEKATAEKDENSVTSVKNKPRLEPPRSQEKPKPASRTLPAVSKNKGSVAAPSKVATAAARRPAKSTTKKSVSFPYSVYLGSYSKTEYLQKAMREYEEKGLAPFWVKVDLGKKGVWHRVFAGCFQTGTEADVFIKEKKIPEGEARLVKYSNLIGTYTSEEALQGRRAALVKLGYSPYVVSGGQGVYRLYVGAFRQKSFSEGLKADLAAKGFQSQIVAR